MSRAAVHVTQRPELPATARTLPARFYTEPELFRRELERIFFAGWLHVGRAEEIPEPGDYRLLELGAESVILLRDEAGEVRAFHNLCRHRGTRLCAEPRGRLQGRIVCPYHAWSYALDGRLHNAPWMEKTAGFAREDHPLHPVHVDLWDGHLFLSFAPDPTPLENHLADLPALFRPWRMAELRRVERIVYPVRANWKLLIQNYSECLHCPMLHPQLQRLSHFLSGDNAPPHPSYLGGRMELRPEVETLTEDGKSPWAPLPGLGEEERRGVWYYAVLPNLLLNLHPDYMMTFTLLPRAHDRTDVVCEWHFHPEEVARPGFDPSPAVKFWDLTNRQDWEVSELAQQGIASRAYRPGPYSNREELLHALDRWVVERLGEDAAVG
jgi:Rieske 2Fe-2S family protein